MKRNIMFKISMLSLIVFSSLVNPWLGAGNALGINHFQTQDAPTNKFCVSEVPSSNAFPTIDLTFRAVDPEINPINDISDKDLRISENGQVPVPLEGGMQVNKQGLGIDYYIVVNRGNRTSQAVAKGLLNTFLNYFDQGKDQVFIYTNEGNTVHPYFVPSSGTPLSQAIADFPSTKVSSFKTSDTVVQSVLNDIEAGSNICQKPKFLLIIAGDDALLESNFLELGQRAKLNFTKIVILHTPTESGLVNMENSYRNFAELASGYYVSVVNGEESRFFNLLSTFRQSYSVKYLTNNGASGVHQLTFVYQGVNIDTKGVNSYSISLMPPQVTLLIPSAIERTAVKSDEAGYIFDKPTEVASVQISFPDGYPRKLASSAALIINEPGKPELRIPVKLTSASSGSDTYQFVWSFAGLSEVRQNDLTVRIEVIDGLDSVVTSSDVPVVILTHIPLNLLAERYYVYILLVVVVVLLVVIVVMRRQIGKGLGAVGARMTAIGDIVRKTIVGGGKRGKPLAILKMIDGPQGMIGQELKVFTEAVKLGRDPQRADMTFYAPEANSSVSGLHARIERVNGSWRIISVSQSSETFLDDIAIPSI